MIQNESGLTDNQPRKRPGDKAVPAENHINPATTIVGTSAAKTSN